VQGADHVRALLVDDRNRVWVGHLTGLIVFQPEPFGGSLASRTLQVMRSTPGRLPGKPGEAIRFGNGDGQAGASIRALHRSSDGRLWIASLDGVARYDGERFETISRGGGASAALSVAEDREGTIWIGTSAAGVARIARQGFTIFTDADGLGRGSIGDLIPDATGSLYVVSGGQYIHRLDGSRFATVRPKLSDQMTENVGLAVGLRDRTGDWWLPGDRGVYRFPAIARLDDLARIPPKAVYTTADGLAGEDVFRLFEDSRGDIWIGRRIPTSLVLTRWERATATFHRYSDAHGLPAFNRVQAFAEDRAGNVWIGFRNGGLARYRAGGFTVFAAADGAPAGVITSLHLDRQGRLWVGSAERGASRIDAPAEDRPRFVHYTTAQGLSSNSISCITDDALGRLYFGVPRGLDRLDADSGRVRHFATADGLAGGAPSAALRDRHGALWFATLQGLSRLIPEPDRQGSPPAIFIGGLRVAGETYPISDLGERDVDTGELRPHQNRLQIDFFGMSTSVDLSYQYKLEPPDREWSEPSDQRSVHYASLSPGAYRFLVRAVAAESLISSAPAAVSFTILPPIWQRWWFIALLGACGALAIHAVYRYRLVRALELERVRTRIATDLHDDVGANLSQIAILSEVARAQAGEREQAIDQPLSRIASLSRESVDAMSEIVWAIDPHHDRFNDLASRMRRLASEVFPPRGIALEFRTTGDPTVPVGAVARRELFLVFKEAINNIIRHAGATRVEVILRVDGRRLSLTVSDDGRGFRPITHGPGQGLRSMRRRAASLGGTLEVISQPGQGTRVTLAIPIRSHASRAAGAREASGVGPV
jgi:ligand-binding sensor domain-containing protein/two-component sensor histidine kinase